MLGPGVKQASSLELCAKPATQDLPLEQQASSDSGGDRWCPRSRPNGTSVPPTLMPGGHSRARRKEAPLLPKVVVLMTSCWKVRRGLGEGDPQLTLSSSPTAQPRRSHQCLGRRRGRQRGLEGQGSLPGAAAVRMKGFLGVSPPHTLALRREGPWSSASSPIHPHLWGHRTAAPRGLPAC